MVTNRGILHSDMNSYYASVEMMLDPSLRGKPVAVCGSTEDRHGIVLAKSDLAKKAGVRTGMVNFEARRLCPNLIIVPPQYDQYLKYTKLAHQIYGRYTDLVEPFGMDECWLDVTGSTIYGTPLEIAESIRQTVKEELGLTVSIGVSFNKIFAKLGSDMKKPDAITEIREDDFHDKVWPLDVGELLYVGAATKEKLGRYGIRTIGDLASTSQEALKNLLGINGLKLWNYANGTDRSRVMHQDFVSPIKSIGHGVTCIADLETPDEVFRVMLELSQDIGHRLRLHGLMACGVQILIRSNDLYYSQYQCKLPFRTQLPSEIADAGFQLFSKRYQRTELIRAITIRGIDLVPQNEPEQLSLLVDQQRRDRRIQLEDTVEDIRRRFGKRAISYACLLGHNKIPGDTGLSAYKSRYALSERLVCGECGTLYRRCTWSKRGKKKVVWRCVSRLDYGTKYCHKSPTLEEGSLQRTILAAISSVMSQKETIISRITGAMEQTLAPIPGETMSLSEIEQRLAEIDEEVRRVVAQTAEQGLSICADHMKALTDECAELKKQRSRIQEQRTNNSALMKRVDDVASTLRQTSPTITEWDESLIRQLVDTVKVVSAEKIIVYLQGGTQVEQNMVE